MEMKGTETSAQTV